MAKAAGGFLRVDTLIERGYDPLAFRYLCLTAHYRGQLNFTWDALDASAVALDRMRNAIHALRDAGEGKPDPALLDRFASEINDDLNTPRALAVAWEALRGDLPPAVKRATLIAFDRVFGLLLSTWQPKVEAVPDAVRTLAEARSGARKSKNWAEADRLRVEIAAAGWEMEDRADGYALKRRATPPDSR
jgi:cysteinyl-tRNA synthetase